ncbi:MAG: DnaJ domain-containing protein [Planctomycetes bacterium]|nr:DnaJ domain-containing protein [Planctomycetota bacterium]
MFARTTVHYWLGRFGLGLVLLTAAGTGFVPRVLKIPDRIGVLTVLLGVLGFHLALTAIAPLVRLLALRARLGPAWDAEANQRFERASLPRRVYYLLAAVAEVDGPMSANEREAVRHFVLERFLDRVHVDELRLWETQPLPVTDRVGLAARIAPGLDDGELDSLFCWCCLVAFADGRFQRTEHDVLHEVARGLGINAPRARLLFHLARAQWLRGQRTGDDRQPGEQLDARGQALAVLGLPDDATPEQIRKRHRELVRKFHPDAQPHLGPMAQREATERFTSIQRAYETLTST